MACFHPKTVWRSARHLLKSGKPRIFFKKPNLFYASEKHLDHYKPEEFQIPCGKMCVGCQETYSRAWAVRCWHESKLHEENCFITLTYNDKFLPKEGLRKNDFVLFMKRFRRFLAGNVGQAKRVRFFMAGEYGKEFFRPHFHACIFGYDFPDRRFWSERDGIRLYTSELLSSFWSVPKGFKKRDFPADAVVGESYGFCSVGDVTFESAAYVARYCAKKVRGSEAEAHYRGRQPEYVRMSLKPGIGKNWFLAYKDSVYPDDSISLSGGRKVKPPRYYDKVFEVDNPVAHGKIKQLRKDQARLSPDNTPARLAVREVVKKAQFKQLKRSDL